MSTRLSIAILATLLVGIVLPASAFAQQLQYCENYACDCSDVGDGFDGCFEFDPGNLLDVSDPDAVREAYNVESTYDSETKTWHIHAETTSPRTHVLPIHDNQGQWESIDALFSYINEAFGANIDPYDEEVRVLMEFDGAYGRYDTLEGQWAATQQRDFLEDLVTSGDGTLTINGQQYLPEIDPNCINGKTSGDLAASQCSEVVTRQIDATPRFGEFGVTRDFDFFWQNKTGAIRIGSGHAVWLPVLAEDVSIENDYYNNSAQLVGQDTCRAQDASTLTCSDWATGVCGQGAVKRGVFQVDMNTWAGSVPNNCQWN